MSATTLSPYQAAGVVNVWLQELDIAKKLPPQMFYTYTNKGYIESVKVENKIKIERDALRDWFDNKYIPKNHPNKVEVTTQDAEKDYSNSRSDGQTELEPTPEEVEEFVQEH